jgi:hypothetical protein
MQSRVKSFMLAVSLFLLCQASLSAADRVKPNNTETFDTVVTITTNPQGMDTYITVPPVTEGEPLIAAFTIQYATPTGSPLVFTGRAQVVFAEEMPRHRPLALTVKTTDGKCWMFKTDVFEGEVPPQCEEVQDMIGLAHSWWNASAKGFPRTHDEFVSQHESAIPGGVGPMGICTTCPDNPCSGGCGSSGCGCTGQGGCGCSTTCQSSWTACCSGCSSCLCCKLVCQ